MVVLSGGLGFTDLLERVMQTERKAKKGKYMVLSEDSLEKDPKMKYKARGKIQPGTLDQARFFFQVLFLWAAMDPQDRGLMLVAAHCIRNIEGKMDAFAVEPDVLYDDEPGSWPIYMAPGKGSQDPGFDLFEDLTGGKNEPKSSS